MTTILSTILEITYILMNNPQFPSALSGIDQLNTYQQLYYLPNTLTHLNNKFYQSQPYTLTTLPLYTHTYTLTHNSN